MHGSTNCLHGSPVLKGPVSILFGGAYTAPARRDTPPHRHTCWELVYYRRGRPRYVVDGVATQAGPGVIWLTAPGPIHAELAGAGFANWYLGLDAPADHPWPNHSHDDAQGSLERLSAAIVQEWSGDRPGRATMLELLATELDIRLRRAGAVDSAAPGLALVIAAEELLDQGEGDRLPVNAIARRLGVAVSTLRAAFHHHRGESPATCLRRRRIRRAVDLLTRTDLGLDAVADQCGFDSASHLSRWIRSEHGCTPGSLRGRRGMPGA